MKEHAGFDDDWDGIIAELVAAGVEGACWQRIDETWGLHEYNKMHEHWKKFGPPVHMAVGAYLGFGKDAKKNTESGKGSAAGLLEAARGIPGGEIVVG